MDVRFGCTACGRCCTGLRLPLTIREAIQWLERGHVVEVLCEAVPWPLEPASDDALAQHKRAITFEARSGTLPVRIGMILAATHTDGCPNLTSEKRCGIYDLRPMVCRIYPAEVNPFVQFCTTSKACPPDAWDGEHPVFLQGGRWASEDLRATIDRSRSAARSDAQRKSRICAALGISLAALANEGYIVHRPEPQQLVKTLRHILTGNGGAETVHEWTIASKADAIRDTLASVGAKVCASLPAERTDIEFLPLFANE